jgi:enoyl-CoA hydratase/carnithine racemase
MSPELGDAFGRYIAFLQKDASVKAVILRGAGKDFSIGGHRDMLIGLGRPGRSEKELAISCWPSITVGFRFSISLCQ